MAKKKAANPDGVVGLDGSPIFVRASPELRARLLAEVERLQASEPGLTLSALVRRLVVQGLDARGKR